MQVKKFEAKSMKEALQMVKQELGPDAIILNAKDNKKSFGLAGRGSIEVTAAISSKSLQRKKYAESRLPEEDRDKFRNKSAKHQKVYIENAVNRLNQKRASSSQEDLKKFIGLKEKHNLHPGLGPSMAAPRPQTSQRYIDIGDEPEDYDLPLGGRRVDDVLEDYAKTGTYVLEDAANTLPASIAPMAAAAAKALDYYGFGSARKIVTPQSAVSAVQPTEEVVILRREIGRLHELLANMQTPAKPAVVPVTQHPGAEYGLPFELSSCFEKLQNAGVDSRYIVEILEKANKELTGLEKKKRPLIEAWVGRYILGHTSVTGGWLKNSDKMQLHLFVGPAGHGKTTSLVKLASQLTLQENKKVAVVSTDLGKVGAADQLKIYCQILNIPFETLNHCVEFPKLLARYSGYDAVLIDYPGYTLKEISEIDQLRSLMPPREYLKSTHLVLSCATKDIDAYEACQRYHVTQYDDILMTKLDESFTHGCLYNLQRKTEKPLYGFGIGPKVPEDLELATRERVLDLIFKITKKN